MIKLNEKKIRILLIVSLACNVLFLGYAAMKRYSRYSAQSNSALHVQPDTVKYDLGRNEVLEILPNDSAEVIMLGNSLTQNFEWHEAFKDVNIKNRGINSDITKGLLQRIDEVVESKPSKIFIEIGLNDLLRGFPVDTVFYNYRELVETIHQKSPATDVYIQSLLPTDKKMYDTDQPVIDSVTVLNKKLAQYCSENKPVYIDLFSTFSDGGKLAAKYDSGDNVHLNGAGYMKWCSLIERYVYE